MKTYTEEKRHLKFDWKKALESNNIVDAKWLYMKDLSANWVTCACGNQCSIIPRSDNDVPEDLQLFRLGIKFDVYVRNKDAKAALFILEEIEKRSSQLIEEILKSNREKMKSRDSLIQAIRESDNRGDMAPFYKLSCDIIEMVDVINNNTQRNP